MESYRALREFGFFLPLEEDAPPEQRRARKRPAADKDDSEPPRKRARTQQESSIERARAGKRSCEDVLPPQKRAKTAHPREAAKVILIGRPQRKKRDLFQECLSGLYAIGFESLLAPRMPSAAEIAVLRRFCEDHFVPLLSPSQLRGRVGGGADQLGEGSFGKAFLSARGDLVVKHASNLFAFRTFILEARVMRLFVECRGFQRLVGVCPERMAMVTRFAGPSLEQRARCASVDSRYSVVGQVCSILQEMHRHGFAHNHVKPGNVCVQESAEGPRVTLIDFGLTLASGSAPRLAIRWERRLTYAPELCSASAGPCSCLSDSYSVGKLLSFLFDEPQMPPRVSRWVAGSQAPTAGGRPYLAWLRDALEAAN